MFFRLETEEESDSYTDEQIACPELFGILCREDMCYLISREIINSTLRDVVEDILQEEIALDTKILKTIWVIMIIMIVV